MLFGRRAPGIFWSNWLHRPALRADCGRSRHRHGHQTYRMTPNVLYRNCRLAFPDALVEGALQTEGGRISAIWIGEPAPSGASGRVVDCAGLILAPGLVDIHNHGG